MSAAVAVNGHGPITNGHAEKTLKSSAVKSRGALKRLKAKAKAERAASETPSESATESDTEVSSAQDFV